MRRNNMVICSQCTCARAYTQKKKESPNTSQYKNNNIIKRSKKFFFFQLTLKKCGRKRPIVYFAMSVVSCCAAAPKAKMPIWRYACTIHVGILRPKICSLIFGGVLFSRAWMISVPQICNFKWKKQSSRRWWKIRSSQVND